LRKGLISEEVCRSFQPRKELIRVASLIFILAFAARIIFLIIRGPSLVGDGPDYLVLARNLATQGIYSMDVIPPLLPSIRRPPLYPFLLAGISLITGGGGETPVFLVASFQCVLDSLVAVMVFALARYSVPTGVATIAGIFYAINPGNIAITRSILTESVFATLIVGAVLAIALCVLKKRILFACLGGGLLGLAILCRPIAFPLAFIFPALVLFSDFPRKWKQAVAIIGIALLMLAPWLIRCSQVAGRFVLVQGGSAGTFYVPTLLDLDQGNEEAIWPRIFGKQTRDPYGYHNVRAKTASEMLEADRIGIDLAKQNILANPGRYIRSRIRAYPHLFLSSFDSFSGLNQSFGSLTAGKEWARLVAKFMEVISKFKKALKHSVQVVFDEKDSDECAI
jgi:hypothetical protein